MSYQPPADLLEVLQKLEYEEALEPDDERYVETESARGSEQTLNRLAKKLGLALAQRKFLPPLQKHVLFFGPTGSGKTTQLRRYAKELAGHERFFVVEVKVALELDRNNLQYADTLMAMAQALLRGLEGVDVKLRDDALEELQYWFSERVLVSEQSREIKGELRTGASVKAGIPGLLSMFAKLTTAFKANATYKDELRREIRNSFSQFATAFNSLLRSAEDALIVANVGRRVLFLIDGTDKLKGEDTRRFFVEDAEQLLAIDAHVVYTAPLALKYEGNLTGRLDADLVLPMIKLQDKGGLRFAPGWDALQEILLRRADRKLFASPRETERLVEHSGGHPRELLRLLKLCCEYAEGPTIDAGTVDLAIKQLASEYRRFLEPDDYRLLARIDDGTFHDGNDERTRKLIYNLALLEYNDGSWRRSHPVVRTLEGYARARSAPV